MADEGRNGDGATVAVRSLSNHKRRIIEAGVSSDGGVDSVSSLPDVILQHILSTLPTRFAIRTSVLSKRWRHVWSDTPSLSFDKYILNADSIHKTLARYTVPKMTSFHLCISKVENTPYMDRWIKFAISRNVENLSLDVRISFMTLSCCSLSWTSLKRLSLRCCNLTDESIATILSGCPVLESLALYFFDKLMVLDLSKSVRLRRLEVDSNVWVPGPHQIREPQNHWYRTKIVAPHIRYLRLTCYQSPCVLVDVSSLTEAKLDNGVCSLDKLRSGFLHGMVINMLMDFQNVEKLTFGANFLKILSLCEVSRRPFPMFKVKDLTFQTMISQYVTPGIVRVLQNSPELKKLTLHTMDYGTIPEELLDKYLDFHGFNPSQCWSTKARDSDNIFSWNREPKHMASFLELMLKTTKKLEKMVVKLEGHLQGRDFEELLKMVPKLSHDNNNVSIALS
ncbi:unnamed protein product [Microthlaspi erraticum]|uniref:F-box domain-containing protein n=1 Tax=Microthlaspi erraticum TaxID=1685480 RepID=A0A6D2IV23_9BRAS|nr:unnamed protein product [Microthlaspi erraticum]